MKKLVKLFTIIILSILSANFLTAGEASRIVSESANKVTAEESINYIEESLKNVTSLADKRSLYIFLGSLQEQLSRYDYARESYVAAAGIAAGDAEDMPKKSNEQLVLDAVRCALCIGDCQLAESYLNSAVRNSSDSHIQAYIKLYSQWSSLCKADDSTQINDAVIMLKAYSEMQSLIEIQPALLLTLWYVTGEESYADKLKKSFATSAEAAVVSGKAQLLPTPFWFFVPRTGVSLPDIANEDLPTETITISTEPQKSSQTEVSSSTVTESSDSTSEKPLYLQLGLFREKDNAQSLVSKLAEKGFTAHILSETRPSGTTYFIVAVDNVNIANELRTSGFDCYPVF